MFCCNCGQQVSDGVNYCSNCGKGEVFISYYIFFYFCTDKKQSEARGKEHSTRLLMFTLSLCMLIQAC